MSDYYPDECRDCGDSPAWRYGLCRRCGYDDAHDRFDAAEAEWWDERAQVQGVRGES